MGKFFKGVYNLYTDTIHRYEQGHGQVLPPDRRISGLSRMRRVNCWVMDTDFYEEVELVRGASHTFDKALLRGNRPPYSLELRSVILVSGKCWMIS